VFALDGEAVTITDLDSLNGTFVNGARITSRVLDHGDQVKIGDSVFVFLNKDAAAPNLGVVDSDDVALHPTALLRKEDVLPLQPDPMVDAPGSHPRTTRELQALLRVSTTLASIREPDRLQRALLDEVFAATPADRAAILISDTGGADFTSVCARARNGDARVPVSRTVVRAVMVDQAALLCNDVATADAFSGAHSVVASATRSVICAPLVVSTRRRGAVYVATSDPALRFDEGHLQLVAAIAALAGVALLNADHIERLEREARDLRSDLAQRHNMIGDSAAMRHLCGLITKAAPSDATVLLLGESGTGKELAARAIHTNSPRARRPFVAITAAVLSDTLLESELFGHEKGAFTGAIAQKKGQMELAEGGTVFLDEIGDLAMPLQIKLLRVLQEREFTRVGGTHPIKMDVRFIAATHRDLDAAVKEGAFRQDLLYRLNVVTLKMPPLRDRRDDIPVLAAFFLSRFSTRCKRRVVGFNDDALDCLVRYDWPGNVRELENAIERAVVLGASERVRLDDLPENVLDQHAAPSGAGADYHVAVHNAKAQIVADALRRAKGSYADAARQLGLHPNNLRRLARSVHVKSDDKPA
jgi:transcriptional regulator with GAF, ATPase, and Fis domain